MSSTEKCQNTVNRIPSEQSVNCLGRACMFYTAPLGVSICEGAKNRLVATAIAEPSSTSARAVAYAIYEQHCSERTDPDQGEGPVGHVVHIFNEDLSPITAIEAAEEVQGEDQLPISLSYGRTVLVAPAERPVPLNTETQY